MINKQISYKHHMMIRIGTSLREFLGVPPHIWLELANILRFNHIEFFSSIFFGNLIKFVDLIGIKTTAVHLPYFDDSDWDLSSKGVNTKFNRLVSRINQYQNQLRIEWLIVHPPEDPNPSWSLYYERLNQFEIPVLLENIKTQNFNEFKEIYKDLKNLLRDRLGFCFDLVHSFLANKEFLNLPENLYSDLQYVHLNDTNSKETDAHLPLGAGVVPLDQVFNFLKQIRFDGVINLEIKPRKIMDAMSILNSYLLILRKFHWQKYLQTKIRLTFIKPALRHKLKTLEIT